MKLPVPLAFILLFASASVSLAGDAKRPNVILILVDDFGYECLAVNGGKSYKTPAIDKLAATGARFTHAYAQPNCTPTRVQILTGMSNVRNYVKFGLLDKSQRTFANLLLRAGYATCVIGKWQLGRHDTSLPKHFGFEEHCVDHLVKGAQTRYTNPTLSRNGQTKSYQNGEYAPDLCHDFAVDFITRNKARPFLLYYPMILTHGPFQPTPDSKDYNPKAATKKDGADPKHFPDMVAYMDKLVGKLVAKLDELGLRDNTLILFTGDNGTGRQITSNLGDGAIDGGKGSTTLAGMHVPLIANWPGHVKAGAVCRDLVDGTDVLPTICEAARVLTPANLWPDGRSFLPQLKGEVGEPREWIYSFWVPLKEKQAAKAGKRGAIEQAFNHDYKLYSIGSFYDLKSDPHEKKAFKVGELTGKAATAAKTLQAALDQYARVQPGHLLKGEKEK